MDPITLAIIGVVALAALSGQKKPTAPAPLVNHDRDPGREVIDHVVGGAGFVAATFGDLMGDVLANVREGVRQRADGNGVTEADPSQRGTAGAEGANTFIQRGFKGGATVVLGPAVGVGAYVVEHSETGAAIARAGASAGEAAQQTTENAAAQAALKLQQADQGTANFINRNRPW